MIAHKAARSTVTNSNYRSRIGYRNAAGSGGLSLRSFGRLREPSCDSGTAAVVGGLAGTTGGRAARMPVVFVLFRSTVRVLLFVAVLSTSDLCQACCRLCSVPEVQGHLEWYLLVLRSLRGRGPPDVCSSGCFDRERAIVPR
ncbi:hypothetical protein J6590_025046 [Homalodisca vitripennis]|nr:hypothetical protein J6590_025046 [Homalodisca vitripennis]